MLERTLKFMDSIGIPVHLTDELKDSFLPGVWIDNCAIYYNSAQGVLGDIYNEAMDTRLT
ncbi:MAG: hypothetical protein AB4426_20745 [Xenococcaceae cyanobacterium]